MAPPGSRRLGQHVARLDQGTSEGAKGPITAVCNDMVMPGPPGLDVNGPRHRAVEAVMAARPDISARGGVVVAVYLADPSATAIGNILVPLGNRPKSG